MRPFRYERPADTRSAVATLAAEPEAAFLGGGTNLVDLMRLGVATPDVLVDVSRLLDDAITELDEQAGRGLRIGAGARNSDVAVDATVRRRYPVLSQALLAGASGQLRNVATVGGNLLQRTRCPYFQQLDKPCGKRNPGDACSARDGDHRNLAILGHSEACIATHPSDMAVALAALGATVVVEGASGERRIAIGGLHRLPGDEPWRDTVLERGDLVTAVELAPSTAAARSTYRKVRDRASFAFAVVSVAAAVEVVDGSVADVRLALGGVAHVPWRAEAAEAALVGGPATEDAFRSAAEAELAAARPLRDNAFKVPLARNLVVRALLDLSSPAATHAPDRPQEAP